MESESFLQERCAEAIEMIDAFVSVGVTLFDVIHTDLDQQLRGYRRGQSVGDVKKSIPYLVPGSFLRRNNLIVRPLPPVTVVLAQLDDLDETQIKRMAALAFLMLHTSPARYQAWLAIQLKTLPERMVKVGPKEIVRRLVRKVGADPGASGAVRLAGTMNYKRKYEPDFPVVDAFGIQARCVDAGELKDLGLLPIPEPPWPAGPLPVQPSPNYSGPRKWPSYSQALRGANTKSDGSADRSQADFTWCMWAIDRGWSLEDVEAQLMLVSEKAQEGGEKYARVTAHKAQLAVERNRERGE